MNDETLERLIFDRALGELDGDAAALLDAYLAADPRAAAHARAAADTVDLARRALGGRGADAPAPPLRQSRIEAAAKARRRWAFARRAAAVAASLVLGLSLGVLFAGNRPPGQAPSQQVAAATPRGGVGFLTAAATQARDDGGFWSAGRLLEKERPPHGIAPQQ